MPDVENPDEEIAITLRAFRALQAGCEERDELQAMIKHLEALRKARDRHLENAQHREARLRGRVKQLSGRGEVKRLRKDLATSEHALQRIRQHAKENIHSQHFDSSCVCDVCTLRRSRDELQRQAQLWAAQEDEWLELTGGADPLELFREVKRLQDEYESITWQKLDEMTPEQLCKTAEAYKNEWAGKRTDTGLLLYELIKRIERMGRQG